jgi:hypothetical protein
MHPSKEMKLVERFLSIKSPPQACEDLQGVQMPRHQKQMTIDLPMPPHFLCDGPVACAQRNKLVRPKARTTLTTLS